MSNLNSVIEAAVSAYCSLNIPGSLTQCRESVHSLTDFLNTINRKLNDDAIHGESTYGDTGCSASVQSEMTRIFEGDDSLSRVNTSTEGKVFVSKDAVSSSNTTASVKSSIEIQNEVQEKKQFECQNISLNYEGSAWVELDKVIAEEGGSNAGNANKIINLALKQISRLYPRNLASALSLLEKYPEYYDFKHQRVCCADCGSTVNSLSQHFFMAHRRYVLVSFAKKMGISLQEADNYKSPTICALRYGIPEWACSSKVLRDFVETAKKEKINIRHIVNRKTSSSVLGSKAAGTVLPPSDVGTSVPVAAETVEGKAAAVEVADAVTVEAAGRAIGDTATGKAAPEAVVDAVTVEAAERAIGDVVAEPVSDKGFLDEASQSWGDATEDAPDGLIR